MTYAVSVIIPAFNASQYLPAALDGILSQTLPPHEVIVVDDGSTDETPRVLESYAGRVRTIRRENQGQSAARNAALEVATGEFVALLDADDLCTPDRLELQVRALREHPKVIACFTGHWVFDDFGETGRYPGRNENADRPPEDFAARLLVHPITAMFRRQVIPAIRFPEGVNLAEDMIFTALLRRQGSFVILPDVLYGYRRHSAQTTAHATDLESLQKRVHWAQQQSARYWPELDVGGFESLAWRAFAEGVQGHYWARRKREFFLLRSQLRANWPAHLPPPPEANLRWYPEMLWRLKGLLDAVRGRRLT